MIPPFSQSFPKKRHIQSHYSVRSAFLLSLPLSVIGNDWDITPARKCSQRALTPHKSVLNWFLNCFPKNQGNRSHVLWKYIAVRDYRDPFLSAFRFSQFLAMGAVNGDYCLCLPRKADPKPSAGNKILHLTDLTPETGAFRSREFTTKMGAGKIK